MPVRKEEEIQVKRLGQDMVSVRIRVVRQVAPYEPVTIEYGADVGIETILSNPALVTKALDAAKEVVLTKVISDLSEIKNAVTK